MKFVKIVLTIIILGSLGSVLYWTHLSVIWGQLEQIGYHFVIIILLSSLSYLMGSIAWRYCFVNTTKVSIGQLFYIRTIGEVISFVNPTSIIAGEASKVHLMREVDIPLSEKVDSILLSRIVLIGTQLSLSVLALLWISWQYNNLWIGVGILLVSTIAVLGVYKIMAMAMLAQRKTRISAKLRHLSTQLSKCKQRLKHFTKYSRRHLIIAIGITTLHWGVGAAELCYILYLLEIPTAFLDALSVDMGIVLLKSAAGFVPGQVGVEEMGNKVLLEIIGISTVGIWISVSIIRRARQLFWIAVSVVLYFFIRLRSSKNWKWQFYS